MDDLQEVLIMSSSEVDKKRAVGIRTAASSLPSQPETGFGGPEPVCPLKAAHSGVSRRTFLKTASVTGAAVVSGFPSISWSYGAADKLRVGLVGCGGRGTGAAMNVLQVATDVIYPPPRQGYHTENPKPGALPKVDDVEIVALADLFEDRLRDCREQLSRVGNQVRDDRCFVGWDAYGELISLSDVDYVILATPPHFRPREVRAAVDAGKHVFMEKPIAVDAPGVRSVLASGEKAKGKGLGMAAGTQRRHQADHVETVRRLHGGAIGEILQGRVYFNIGEIWMIPREPGWGDMEWHVRNWNYFTWLSGDILVEQHIHTLDLANWVMGAHPVRAYGMGGRLARPSHEYGHIYDHFAVEYEYANGAVLFSQNRQIDGCTNRVGAAFLGRGGTSNGQSEIVADGERWRFEGSSPSSLEQVHIDLIASIRSGNPINESRAVAESTLTAIMGRDSAYSGQLIEWDAAMNAQRDFTPDRYHFGEFPFPEVPMPRNYRFY
jgi:predicted dehydrogenase